jgi:tRNA A-37 threonylcarbamoyl transferase component Bud32
MLCKMSSYYFIKKNVQESEYFIQNSIYNLEIINVPKIYNYDKNTETLVMKNIDTLNVADMYGDKFNDIPAYIIDEMRNIISTLYLHGIEYPDITPYNFIEFSGKIWLIDFEHAKYNSNYETYDRFILEFINGATSWNPKYL